MYNPRKCKAIALTLVLALTLAFVLFPTLPKPTANAAITIPTTATSGVAERLGYVIKNVSSGYNFDISGDNVISWWRNGGLSFNQVFRFKHLGNGEYKIVSLLLSDRRADTVTGVAEKILSVNTAKQVVVTTRSSSTALATNQRWYVVKNGSNYNIVNKAYPAEYVSFGGSSSTGVNAVSSTSTTGSVWELVDYTVGVFPSAAPSGIVDGYVYDLYNSYSDLYVEAPTPAVAPFTGAPVMKRKNDSSLSSNQHFKIYSSGGYGSLKIQCAAAGYNINTQMHLSVSGDGGSLSAHAFGGSYETDWQFIPTTGGYYIVNSYNPTEFLRSPTSVVGAELRTASVLDSAAVWKLEGYTFEMNNYYDVGFRVRFGGSANAVSSIVAAQNTVSEILKKQFALNVTTNTPQNFQSKYDIIKGTTASSPFSAVSASTTISTGSIVEDFIAANGNGTNKKMFALWVGHADREPNQALAWSNKFDYAYMGPEYWRGNTVGESVSALQQYTGVFLHETSHNLGLPDQYHNIKNGICINQMYCLDCAYSTGDPNRPKCIMDADYKLSNYTDSNLYCTTCRSLMKNHLEGHHLINS